MSISDSKPHDANQNPLLAISEWDFRSVPDDELFPCKWWEYARESGRIRAFYQSTDSDYFPSPGFHPEIRTIDGKVMQATRQKLNTARMQFSTLLREWAEPVRLTIERSYKFGMKSDSLDLPWQQLPHEVRSGVVEDVAPYFAEHPWLTYLPFNRCSDMRDQGLADAKYRCAQFDEKQGIERLRVQIDWAGFTDAQIIHAFTVWVKENRPPGVGRSNDKGKRKGRGLDAHLKALAILRLMNFSTQTAIRQVLPLAWQIYGSMDWPRARKEAGIIFRDLFHFLPETDRPLRWPTAGKRST